MHPTEVKNKQSLWSFSHRTRAHKLSDSFESESSDSESRTETKSNIPSDDTRFFQQLDISSRHETVEYKPNPWRIARINAASRAPNIKEFCVQASSEDTRRNSQSRAPQGRIVDAFKVQAERKPPRAPAPSKALKVTKLKSNTPQVSREDRLSTQGKNNADPRESSHLSNPYFLDNVPQSRHSCAPDLSSTPKEDHRDPRFQPRSCAPTSSWTPDSECGDTPINAEPTPQPYVVHISTSNTPAILLSSAPQEDIPDQVFQSRSCFLTPSWTPDIERNGVVVNEEPSLQRGIAHISTSNTSVPPESRPNVSFLSCSSPLIRGSDYPTHASDLPPKGFQSSPLRPSHRSVHPPARLLSCTPVSKSFSQRPDIRFAGHREFSGMLHSI